MGKRTSTQRRRGHIEPRANGTYRAIVSAGFDPFTGKRIVLKATAETEALAQIELTKLLRQVDEQKHPRGDLTVVDVINKWIAVADPKQARRTKVRRDQLVRDYIAPRFGNLKASKLTAEHLENYYALLQTCKSNVALRVNHRAASHLCEKLSNSSVRQIHFILTAAFKRAVKWGYLDASAPALAEPPAFEQGKPSPPEPEQLASCINEAWRDFGWGMFLWVTMMTAGRRGESCVLRWSDIDFRRGGAWIERAGDQYDGRVEETTTKTKQQKWVTFEEITLELLLLYRTYCEDPVGWELGFKSCLDIGELRGEVLAVARPQADLTLAADHADAAS